MSAGESCKSVIMEEEAARVREAEGKTERTVCMQIGKGKNQGFCLIGGKWDLLTAPTWLA